MAAAAAAQPPPPPQGRDQPTETTPLVPSRPPSNADASPPAKGLRARIEGQCKYPLPVMIPSMLALWCCLFLAALDGTVTSTLLAPISSEFGAADRASALGVSFLLSVSACTPLYGRLSDILGRRPAFLTALLFFSLGTAGCAAASSMSLLIAARAVAGAGAGGILTCASTVMTDLVSLRARGLMQGVSNIIFGLGGASGGIFAGLISDRFGWRTVFGAQIPFLALSIALIARFIQIPLSDEIRATPLRQRLKKIDVPGPLLLVVSVWSLLRLLDTLTEFAGVPSASASASGASPVSGWQLCLDTCVFLLAASAFLSVEAWVVAHPILPLHLLRRMTPACVSAVYFLSSCAYYALFFYYPTYFVAVRALPASQAGLRILPLAVVTAFGSVGAGIIMSKTGRYCTLQTTAAFLPVVSVAWLATWTPTSPAVGSWVEYIGITPAGLGLAVMYTTLLVAILAASPGNDVGVVNGLIYMSRTLGQVVGVGSAGTLLQFVLARSLVQRIVAPGDVPHAHEIVQHALKSITYIDTLPPALASRARAAYADGLRAIFIQVTILSAVAFVACLGIGEHSMEASLSGASDRDVARRNEIVQDAEEQIEGEML